jgi:hypothetical protein
LGSPLYATAAVQARDWKWRRSWNISAHSAAHASISIHAANLGSLPALTINHSRLLHALPRCARSVHKNVPPCWRPPCTPQIFGSASTAAVCAAAGQGAAQIGMDFARPWVRGAQQSDTPSSPCELIWAAPWRGRSSREHSGLLYIHRPPPCRAVHPFTFRPPFHLHTARAGRPGRSARRKESVVQSGEDWWARQLFFKAKTGHVRGGMRGSERARARGSGTRTRSRRSPRAHTRGIFNLCVRVKSYTRRRK